MCEYILWMRHKTVLETMLQWDTSENSLAVLCASTAVGMGSVPGLRTKDLPPSPPSSCHAAGPKKKKEKERKKTRAVLQSYLSGCLPGYSAQLGSNKTLLFLLDCLLILSMDT